MRTYYIILVAIFLPKLLLSTTVSDFHPNNDPNDCFVVKKHINSSNSALISLPDILCPTDIDTILPSRRDCEAVIDYNVQFNTNNCPISQFELSQNFSDDDIFAFACDGTVETSHLRVFDLSQSGLPTQIFLTGVDAVSYTHLTLPTKA